MSASGLGKAEFADVSSAALFMVRHDFSLWTRDELYQWLSRFRLRSARPWGEVAGGLWAQHVDGEAFLLASEEDWRGCAALCADSMAALNACREMFYQLRDNHSSGPCEQPPRWDPSVPPAPSADEVSDIDVDMECGDGEPSEFTYGQLVILGNQKSPLGSTGAALVMKRRAQPNGLRHMQDLLPPLDGRANTSSALPRILFQAEADTTRDRFQVGRYGLAGCNDLVLTLPAAAPSPPATSASWGKKSKPVYRNGRFVYPPLVQTDCAPVAGMSRFAYRIECERETPHRCYIYASGYDEDNVLFVSSSWTRVHVPMEPHGAVGSAGTTFGQTVDALPSGGVRVWSPIFEDWVEVSVRGNVCVPRENNNNVAGQVLSFRTNEITSGSIIDVGGAYVLFQGAHLMSRQVPPDTPDNMLKDINKKRPHCPVLFQAIEAQYLSDRDKLINTYVRKFSLNHPERSPLLERKSLIRTTVSADGSTDDADATLPFVFSSCGHVYAYSKELFGRPCPLCRVMGNFTQVVYPFLSSICHAKPTHVFNPCGHAASEEVCDYWSSLRFLRDEVGNKRKAACPFCLCKLCGGDNSSVPSYTKLIFQFEDA